MHCEIIMGVLFKANQKPHIAAELLGLWSCFLPALVELGEQVFDEGNDDEVRRSACFGV